MAVFIDFLVIIDNKLSSQMYQISQHNNYTNKIIHSYTQMIKMIMNLSIKKGDKNDDSSPKLTHIQNTLLIVIFDTPENYLSRVEGKAVTRKVHKYSTLFFMFSTCYI